MPNLDSSIFKINHPTGPPSPGTLLVAEPFLKEDHFNHAVILLVEHTAGKPAMGLVLNKPTGYTMGEAIEGVDESVDLPIYCGGPMSCDRLFYLHSLPGEFEGSRHIAGDLFIGGDFDQVKRYLNMGLPTRGRMRFFVGYSGWGTASTGNGNTRPCMGCRPAAVRRRRPSRRRRPLLVQDCALNGRTI